MFQVPPSKRAEAENRFEFSVGGEAFSVPLLKFLPFAAAEAFEAGHQATAVIAACDDDGARAALRSMDGAQMEAFMTAWSAASGVTEGESGASSDS